MAAGGRNSGRARRTEIGALRLISVDRSPAAAVGAGLVSCNIGGKGNLQNQGHLVLEVFRLQIMNKR